MRARYWLLAIALVAIAVVAVPLAGGCGDDETMPARETEPTTPAEGGYGDGSEDDKPESDVEDGDGENANDKADTGGTVAPGEDSDGAETGSGGTSPEDSEESDIPPAKESPAEAFEKDCERNPEACG